MSANYSYLVSLENVVGDWEPRSEQTDELDNRIFSDEVLGKVHGQTKQIVEMLLDGYNFLEISQELNLKESQVYKVKRELALLYKNLHETSTPDNISIIIRLYIMGKLKNLAKHTYSIWYADNALKEYKRPSKATIEDYIEDTLLEIADGAVVYRTPQRKRVLYPVPDFQLRLFP